MPWFAEFVGAVELVRRQTRDEGLADPVGEYFAALNTRDVHLLESAWPGSVVIYDPRAGEVSGHRHLRHFVTGNQSWLADRHARIETVGSTYAGGRAVVELLAYLDGDQTAGWPVAVVAESPDDMSVVFRTYCSQWPIAGRHEVRSPILAGEDVQPADVVGRYQTALGDGDAQGIADTFALDGYYREPIGANSVHRGTAEIRSFFGRRFGTGGIDLQRCTVTDDGVTCALEYNVLRWGGRDLPPQAGLGVYERGPDGLLAAARIYDDVAPPGG
jgi:hypothetical protein